MDSKRFVTCWLGLGAADATVFDELAEAYSESHRYYHTAEHIAECLCWLDQHRDFAERPAEVEVAVWFHDAIYDPSRDDNEARSAELQRRAALRAGIASATAERIARLIRATEPQDAVGGDAALFADIDLSILGASPARYDRYEADVRREYRVYTDEQYAAGRISVLRGFLERMAIYRTVPFAARLERQARDNLVRAIRNLETRGGPSCSSC